MFPLAPRRFRCNLRSEGPRHRQPVGERGAPVVPDGSSNHGERGLVSRRSKGGSIAARRTHRLPVWLQSTRHHSPTRRAPDRRGGTRMHELRARLSACVRQCQTAFTDWRKVSAPASGRLRLLLRRHGRGPMRQGRDELAFLVNANSSRDQLRPQSHALKTRRGPASRVPAGDSLRRAHGRVGHILGEIDSVLKLPTRLKVAPSDSESLLSY
jgi:hypothetical protein